MAGPWYIELYRYFPDYNREPYVQNTAQEVEFIEREIGHDRSKLILDVGCGTGRHALELARRGYRVVGVDLSESLLAQGWKMAKAEALAVTFILGDARVLHFESRFNVVLSLCQGAFSLMETDEMDYLILENLARALKPGGKLILTAPNAAYMLAHAPEGGVFDPVTLREIFTLEAARPDGGKSELTCTQRYYTCPELRWLLKRTGFERVEFFSVTERGFYRRVVPAPDHFELGVIARKTAP